MSVDEFAISAVAVAACLIIGMGVYGTTKETDEYRAKCVASGGDPVFNGKHYECIKGANQ